MKTLTLTEAEVELLKILLSLDMGPVGLDARQKAIVRRVLKKLQALKEVQK